MKCVTDGGLREDGCGGTGVFCFGAAPSRAAGNLCARIVLVVLIAALDEEMLIRVEL